MNKRELLVKMKAELSNYQIGLHNIGLDKYKAMLGEWNKSRNLYELTGSDICEKYVAEHIMQTGLYVTERAVGLKSTVKFLDNLSDDSLDYTYNKYTLGKVFNVIIGVPKVLYYEGDSYSLGDLGYYANVGNMLFLNPNVFPQFIYGYYERDIVEILEEDVGQGRKIISKILYSPDLEFYQNPEFYGLLTENMQEDFLSRVFENDGRLLRILKLANNNSVFGLLFCSSFERFVVRETRKQVKSLTYERKV